MISGRWFLNNWSKCAQITHKTMAYTESTPISMNLAMGYIKVSRPCGETSCVFFCIQIS